MIAACQNIRNITVEIVTRSCRLSKYGLKIRELELEAPPPPRGGGGWLAGRERRKGQPCLNLFISTKPTPVQCF